MEHLEDVMGGHRSRRKPAKRKKNHNMAMQHWREQRDGEKKNTKEKG